jgi:hypothetical protein
MPHGLVDQSQSGMADEIGPHEIGQDFMGLENEFTECSALKDEIIKRATYRHGGDDKQPKSVDGTRQATMIIIRQAKGDKNPHMFADIGE